MAEQKTDFWKIAGGVFLTGIGVAIIANPVNNMWLILGIIFIASGVGILLKD